MKLQNDLLLRACRREPVERTPVWFMRQAGRYLPEYRAVRERTDFLTLCKTPELAAEVTIQPVDLIGVDAAIIFSDILVVPEAMGMTLVVEEGKGGPQFPEPIRSGSDIEKLPLFDAENGLRYVMDALLLAKKNLASRVPLIGFSGSPWTLATYMVEGRGSKNFRHIKELIFTDPRAAHRLLEKLAANVAAYLAAQMRAGADVVQIFDTWGGILAMDHFREFSLRYIRQVLDQLPAERTPVIVFCKDCGHSLEHITELGVDVVGIDWVTDIGDAKNRIGHRSALQGNMDPCMLFASPERIQKEVETILAKVGHFDGHIFNLGHGILPETPVENVKTFVESVKTMSRAYRREKVRV
jgi:uroporphyrinogen decarboxylase